MININTKIKLNNDVKIPIIGLGTYQIKNGKEFEDAVIWALENGYKHIDTATIYGNESSIGNAIKKSRVQRDEIFITTKLWNSDHNDPQRALDKSLKNLRSSYIDLYLIHWPVEKVRNETWKILGKLMKEGKCKAIGVSNFTIKHLNEILKSTNVVPVINQVEFSPYLYQKDLLEFCNSRNIYLEAYSPLTKGRKLVDKKLVEIARNYRKTPAQVLIRWCLQHNVIVIPKSSKKDRIKENINVFDFNISKEHMELLDNLNEDYRTSWDPTDIV